MTGTAKESALTIPQTQIILKDKYKIDVSLATIRRVVDSMELAVRFGPYRLLDKKDVPRLAKELKSKRKS